MGDTYMGKGCHQGNYSASGAPSLYQYKNVLQEELILCVKKTKTKALGKIFESLCHWRL